MSVCYVNVCGGLGNQLFQVAAGYAYSKKYDKELVINPSGWTASQGQSPETYKDNLFKNFKFGSYVTRDVIGLHEKDCVFEEITDCYGSVSLNGYYQSMKYFEEYKDEFISLLELSDVKFQPDDNDVCFHIRRGDYLKFANIHHVCDTKYFENLFYKFRNKNIYIITDSPDYVLEEFKHRKFKLISSNSELEDLTFISRFDNVVCSNSSFSWWATLIGNSKNVYVPSKWFADGRVCEDIYRPEMIKIDVS